MNWLALFSIYFNFLFNTHEIKNKNMNLMITKVWEEKENRAKQSNYRVLKY